MRTFQAERLAELEAERLKREQEEEEANNPMKVSLYLSILCRAGELYLDIMINSHVTQALEHRTKESRHEMDVLDALEELKDLNARNAHGK